MTDKAKSGLGDAPELARGMNPPLLQTRAATLEDLPSLQRFLFESGCDATDLQRSVIFLAEENGAKVGCIGARMVWQLEPLIVRSDSQSLAADVAVSLANAIEAWLAGPENISGVRWFFTHTESPVVESWAVRLGWRRIYSGAQFFMKQLRERK